MKIWIVLFALALAGCSPCQTYCNDAAGAMEQLIPAVMSEAELEGISYFDEAGGFDAEAYRTACSNAPDTADCETCSSWFRDAMFGEAEIENDCNAAFADSSDENAVENCQRQCGAAGLGALP